MFAEQTGKCGALAVMEQAHVVVVDVNTQDHLAEEHTPVKALKQMLAVHIEYVRQACTVV